MAFLSSSALAPSPARILLLQATGVAAGGRGLLLQGAGVGAGAGRALVAVLLPRCTARAGDQVLPDDDDGDTICSKSKELAPVALAFAQVESECKAGYVTADGLLGAMDGLHSMVHVLVGTDAAAHLRPYLTRPTVPLSTEDAKLNFLWNLARDFVILVQYAKWAAQGVLRDTKLHQFFVVHGDKELLEHLTATCLDSQSLLTGLVAKAVNGPFPLTQGAVEDVVRVAKSFVKLEVESCQGYARADTVVAAMDGLKTTASVFAGTGMATGLRPHNPWPKDRLSGEDNIRDLALALGTLLEDVKFRCHYY